MQARGRRRQRRNSRRVAAAAEAGATCCALFVAVCDLPLTAFRLLLQLEMNLTAAADFTVMHTYIHTYMYSYTHTLVDTHLHSLRAENVRQFRARQLRQMLATVEQLPRSPPPSSTTHTPHWLNDFAVGVCVAVDVDVAHSRLFVVKLVLQIFCVHLFGGSNKQQAMAARVVGREERAYMLATRLVKVA